MKCMNCGEEGSHFVCPGGGDPGFFHCKPKGVCKTCRGKKEIENSSSGIAMGGSVMVPCPTCNNEQPEQKEISPVKNSCFISFDLMSFLSNLSCKVVEIVYEEDLEKRKFLFDEYCDLEKIHRLYLIQAQNGQKEFSWRYLFDNRKLCLNDLGHFKSDILNSGITEEEWYEEVESNYKSIGEEKTKEYVKKYEEYVKKHRGNTNEN